MVYGLVCILIIIIVFLLVKLYSIKKSAREIADSFADRLKTDTNTLIDVSTDDKDIRRLAADINTQLKILRNEQLKFRQGDSELKNAVTNISHDLRTPLTAICGYLDILENEEKSEEVSRYLKIISERAELMKQLTEELFRYSVIVSDDNDFQTEEILINQVLEDCIIEYYAVLKEKNIYPDIQITEKQITAKLNKDRLARIFSNLLNNAVKYSDGDLEIRLTDNGEIIFANTAKELSSVQVERLFDRFYTVKTARNSTGLGLSIARTLAEEMGGTISAEYINEKLYIKLEFK